MDAFNKLKEHALDILRTKLSDKLHYHSIDHTFDVYRVCEEYIQRDKIDRHRAELLRIGALTHDIGFTISNKNHEEHSVTIATELMEKNGYTEDEINLVAGLIRATKIPQLPKTDLERIICDADLDYLGGDQFYEISNRLFQELQEFGVIDNIDDWNKAQINFLEKHYYHTDFANEFREPGKQLRLSELKKAVANA
ncbi:HD domain-containing protein [Marinigracilibium pacificum]|uniref:HD domain-containing protein n=1 Tax=Marinigracilibium pacificum TaxID=2729599 RepID=A0A848IYU6_9BACT|nr:HD domain-containing protein [Marinigracilibium pacificum]NMM48511.1 HD domain-containing protein [Marinigracilibium pacificum]